MRTPGLQAALIVAGVFLAVWLLARQGERTGGSSAAGPAVYFGGVWVALGVAPILMAGYYSPRHMYLASAGWAVLAGTVFDVLWTRTSLRLVRQLAAVSAAALVVFYAVQLRVVVRDWNQRAGSGIPPRRDAGHSGRPGLELGVFCSLLNPSAVYQYRPDHTRPTHLGLGPALLSGPPVGGLHQADAA
jgi:hypothetical protein